VRGRVFVTVIVTAFFISTPFTSISLDNKTSDLQDNVFRSDTYYFDEYYEGTDSLQGELLHAQLYDIIRNHTVVSYNSVWEHLRNIDEDPTNSANVTLFYMQRSHSENDTCGDGNDCTSQSWNREHVWPKSHGDFGTSMTKVAGTDLHALRPVDNTVNSARSDKDFGNAEASHWECTECDSSPDFWEPADITKGDAARAVFYMDVRYNGYGYEPALNLVNNSTQPSVGNGYLGELCVIYSWHLQDPVSNIEIERNNDIYAIQGNRNPFVDDVNFVENIWGNICDDVNDDSDDDGYDDDIDAFPTDPSEWYDSDLDGIGDNSDAFPFDDSETLDSDSDGFGDNSDIFPMNENEWYDSDLDGIGDNSDQFPNDSFESIDSDLDGIGDNSDAFPFDDSEILDSDSDGFGDNSDIFPMNENEWYDSDLDGVGDNFDLFPFDGSEIIDTDSDGVGDNSDAFPLDDSETLDSDSDGVGDNADLYPFDSSRSESIESYNYMIFLLIILAFLGYYIFKK
jgi:endonuclease I